MKVALFGGTFDPVHNGHVNAAAEIVEQGLVDEVWFIPVYWHAFKENGKVSSLADRRAMIELAIDGRPNLKAIDLNDNPTYTIDTILKLKKRFPENDYFWLIGTDLIPEFQSWKNPEKILEEARLILFPVPGTKSNKSDLVEASKPIHVSAKEVDLSSTVVREKFLRGEDVSELLPESVLQYIKENNLYKQGV